MLSQILNTLIFSLGKTDPICGPYKVTIELTNKCNLRCNFCQRWKIQDEGLSTDEWKKILADLKRNHVKTVSLSGGEPLLRKDIFELINFCRNIGLSATLDTNGILVSKFANKIMGSGLKAIHFSIDSSDPKVHDYLRGVKGAFDMTVKGIESLSERGNMKLYIGTAITKKSYSKVDELIRLAKGFHADGITFIKLYDFPSGNFAVEDKSLKEISWDIFLKSTEEHLEPRFSTIPLSYYRKIKEFVKNPDTFYSNMRCIAGFMHAHIDCRGAVYPCFTMFKQMGDLRKEEFRKIWWSKKAREIREDIKSGRHPKCWAGCIGGPNLLLSSFRRPDKLVSFLKNDYNFLRYILQVKR